MKQLLIAVIVSTLTLTSTPVQTLRADTVMPSSSYIQGYYAGYKAAYPFAPYVPPPPSTDDNANAYADGYALGKQLGADANPSNR